MHRLLNVGTLGFPAWVLAASVLALVRPGWFTWFSGPLIPVGLGLIMLGMGLTLEVDDFRRVLRRPLPIGLGVVLQFGVMPATGYAVAAAMGLPAEFAAGLILVSCCPGGVASNVISYLSLADVPASVSMTAVSTVVSVAMTPLLTAWLAGSRIEVPAAGLLLSTFQVVVFPILAGLFLKRSFRRLTTAVLPFGPFLSVVLITLIVASIIGASRSAILESGGTLLIAVFWLHAGGFGLGYALSRLFGRGERTARTVAIEVGMQNSGLGVVLAGQNFTSPLVAVPSALSSLMHSLVGSALAGIWRFRSTRSAPPARLGGSPSPRPPS